jgi:phage shock protein A
MRRAHPCLEDLADKINQVRAELGESANVTIDTTELEQDVSNAASKLLTLKEQLTETEHELEELRHVVEEIKNCLVGVTAHNEKTNRRKSGVCSASTLSARRTRR